MIIKCTVKKNAKSVVLSPIFPKVIFRPEALDGSFIISSPEESFRIPHGEEYYVAEPTLPGWGDITDSMQAKLEGGTLYFSYSSITGVPTTTKSPTTTLPPDGCPPDDVSFLPHRTQTGSKLDYRWRYNGTLNPSDIYTFQALSPPGTTGWPNSFWWYSGPVAVNGGEQLIVGNYDMYSFNKDGSVKWHASNLDPEDSFSTYSPSPSLDAYLPIVSEDYIYANVDVNEHPRVENGKVNYIARVEVETGAMEILPFVSTPQFDADAAGRFYWRADELIMGPDGKTIYALGEEAGTYAFRLVESGIELIGKLEGHDFEDEGEGMSSSLRFQHIPGKNEMYYSGYSSMARIDCTTNTVVWSVPSLDSYDEVFVIHPRNGNLIKSVTVGHAHWPTGTTEEEEYSSISFAEYSYVDGSLVKFHRLKGLKRPPRVTYLDYNGMFEQTVNEQNSISSVTATRDCKMYVATDFGQIATYDFISETTTSIVDMDPNLPSGLEYTVERGSGIPKPRSTPDVYVEYYGTHVITKDNVWWGYYYDKNISTMGFYSYDGGEYKLYTPDISSQPGAALYDMTGGLAIVGDEIYYGTNNGISKLIVGRHVEIPTTTAPTTTVPGLPDMEVQWYGDMGYMANNYGAHLIRTYAASTTRTFEYEFLGEA